MEPPLVTVICLCFNHERFVREAILSVKAQTHAHVEIIVVDDASTDNSRSVIEEIIRDHSEIRFVPLDRNVGNCAAFNRGLSMATGEYIVDFATDDVMLPDRIAEQLGVFRTLDHSYGVVFTDVMYIDESGRELYQHFPYLRQKRLISCVPEGNVFRDVLTTYFISAPSMLVRSDVFEKLGGYDETLAYEDFDFWVRSSRVYRYAFLEKVLTKVRKIKGSLSSIAYERGSRQLLSTYAVCKKAVDLVRDEKDRSALVHRVRYELRHAVWSGNFEAGELFFGLLKSLAGLTASDRIMEVIMIVRIPLWPLRRIYHALRYR